MHTIFSGNVFIPLYNSWFNFKNFGIPNNKADVKITRFSKGCFRIPRQAPPRARPFGGRARGRADRLTRRERAADSTVIGCATRVGELSCIESSTRRTVVLDSGFSDSFPRFLTVAKENARGRHFLIPFACRSVSRSSRNNRLRIKRGESSTERNRRCYRQSQREVDPITDPQEGERVWLIIWMTRTAAGHGEVILWIQVSEFQSRSYESCASWIPIFDI